MYTKTQFGGKFHTLGTQNPKMTTPTTGELRHLPTEATATLPWAPTGSSLFSLYLCNEMQYPYQLTSVQFSSIQLLGHV